ncbi:hypothetical protein COO60DRAFT_1535092 [Scenedesmus sp. NREL 46B-D3]|nr:hypothetical protein COO60DRAFT_1535092 [Scenedesmus sp. NREL 46B-D3]
MAGGKAEVDSTAQAILAAAERFCNEKNGVSLTQKRLLYEFLAYPGPNGKTLSGLFAEGTAVDPQSTADIVYMSRRWFGLHIIKHYYVMRQYKDASGVVLGFLKFMKAEGTLPSSMSKDLDTAIQTGEQGVVQLPAILRIMKQPCARNEAYSRVYPLRPFPLCTVPAAAEVRDSSSRHWPADTAQVNHAWLGFVSERCRVEPEELDAMVQAVPKQHTVIKAVNPDNSVVFKQYGGEQTYSVPFSAKRAADILPGMVMIATLVKLSNGDMYATDWGYVYPTYYAPVMDHAYDFGPNKNVQLVY